MDLCDECVGLGYGALVCVGPRDGCGSLNCGGCGSLNCGVSAACEGALGLHS